MSLPASIDSSKKRKADAHPEDEGIRDGPATAAAAGAAAGDSACRYERCCLPPVTDSIWCSQHKRILNVGRAGMDAAWHRYKGEDSIWKEILEERDALRAEALYATHAYMIDDPPNQVPMGTCYGCDLFFLSLWRVTRASGGTLLYCWSCSKGVAAKDAEEATRL